MKHGQFIGKQSTAELGGKLTGLWGEALIERHLPKALLAVPFFFFFFFVTAKTTPDNYMCAAKGALITLT